MASFSFGLVSQKATHLKHRIRIAVELAREPNGPDVGTQKVLSELWRTNARELRGRRISDFGFSAHSQTDEDGILLYLFSIVGTTNQQAIEICAGDGIECNAANLILNHGWHALLVDGDLNNVAKARRFYSQSPRTQIFPPKLMQAWITRGSVNDLIRDSGFSGEIDLLSLDLDGVDYWIWEAITVVSPRVVVLEYQDILGPDRLWTVPYADDFVAREHSMTGAMPNFAGASLRAFTKLAHSKGYRLIGVNGYGFNAFFMRNDVGTEQFAEIPVEDCFTHAKTLEGMEKRFPLVANMPWVEV
jgi:hypothetical protein